MKPSINIIKIGGHVIDDEPALACFLDAYASLGGLNILVHGGGKCATDTAKQLNIPQHMVDGRRITDEATLKVVTMVYAGYINKTIVAGLQARNCNALGLCGADGNLIRAHKRTVAERDFGFAGDIDEVNTELLDHLLQAGCSIVVAPVTHNKRGQLLNTNADTMAKEIASAMSASYTTQLIYCFEKEGVLQEVTDNSSVLKTLSSNDFEDMKAMGQVHTGMLPKLHNAFTALDSGVGTVRIGKWDNLIALVSGAAGTTIHHGTA